MIALGGLSQDQFSETIKEVPFLSKIPIIGQLFKSTETTIKKAASIIFIRPVIIENENELKNESLKRYERVKNQYKGDKINFYLGDSSDVLTDILPSITGKSIIFLDGHWSGDNTGKGIKDCPLYEEITSIIHNHIDEAIIIIDDVRMFSKGPNNCGQICNWEEINIENILQIVKTRMTNYYLLPSSMHNEDRMVIHISK